MDDRMQGILQSFENQRIGVDEPFRFRCTMCGKCCIHREDILLNPRDAYNMAKELKISPEELLKQYCEVYVGQDSRMPVVRLMPRGNVQRCPMLKDRKCMVHKVKPTVCAMYPIGRGIRYDTKKKNSEITEEDIQYFFANPGCGDEGEIHTVREWLESFGIPVADGFFVKWQNVVYRLSMSFRKLEKSASPRVMELFWNAALGDLYLEYDTGQEFPPQFERNMERLFSAITGITEKMEKEADGQGKEDERGR